VSAGGRAVSWWVGGVGVRWGCVLSASVTGGVSDS
jgi:hypothetical protein